MTLLRRGALLVQSEQPLQNLLVAQVRRPAVGGSHGGVEIAVGVVEPGHVSSLPLVVEIGERALLEDGGLRLSPVGI